MASIVDTIMEAGSKAGSIFGTIKDAGTGASKGFWDTLWQK